MSWYSWLYTYFGLGPAPQSAPRPAPLTPEPAPTAPASPEPAPTAPLPATPRPSVVIDYDMKLAYAGVGGNIQLWVYSPGTNVMARLFGVDDVGRQVYAGGGVFKITWVSPSSHVHVISGDVLVPFPKTDWPGGSWSIEKR
jgi:hypothetical protein